MSWRPLTISDPEYLAGKTWSSSKMDVSPVNNPETYRHWFPQSLGHNLWAFLQKVCRKILRFQVGFDRTDRHDDASSEAGLWSLTDKIGLYWGWTLPMSRAKVSQSDLAYTWGDITGVCVQLPSMPVLRPYLFGSWISVPAGNKFTKFGRQIRFSIVRPICKACIYN